MKLIAMALVSAALVASPVIAQDTSTTHVRTTTKEVHATNVPRETTHHVVRRHHHVVRCACTARQMRHHSCSCPAHVRTHHIVKKTTMTTSH